MPTTPSIIRPIVLLVFVWVGATDVMGQAATYLGRHADVGPGWRSSTVAKLPALDADGDGGYGSVGYLVPISTGGTGPVSVASQLPAYVASATSPIGASIYGETSGFLQTADDPTQAIGPVVSDVTLGYLFTASGPQTDFINITLASPVTFVLGIFFDHHTATNYANSATAYTPTDLRVRQTIGGSADSGLINMSDVRNGTIDFAFFTITGNAGDQFTISGTLNGGWANQGIAGITFETVPEPATSILSVGGLIGLWCYLRRRR